MTPSCATSQSPVPLHCPSCHTRLMDLALTAGSRVDVKCRRCSVLVIILSAAAWIDPLAPVDEVAVEAEEAAA